MRQKRELGKKALAVKMLITILLVMILGFIMFYAITRLTKYVQ